MTRTNGPDGRDVFDCFENALCEGATAVDYWSNLGRTQRTASTLVNLLLIEFESRNADLSDVATLVRQFKCSVDAPDSVAALVGGAYEIIVGRRRQPHIDWVNGLDCRYEKYLALSTDPFHLGQAVVGRYRIEQRIGHGAFGVVYKCHDEKTGEKVACKAAHRTSDEHMSRVRRHQLTTEWIAMDRLSGTGCPQVQHLSTHDDAPFLTMEFVDGQSLRDLVIASSVHAKTAAQLLADVSKTVGFAHVQHRVIHRDLKPENVLIGKDGKVFVVDFGLVECFAFASDVEQIAAAAGTKEYMAPEMLSSTRRTIDGRADIYAIGVMLHELLTGEIPTGTGSPQKQSASSWPRFIPEPLSTIGMRCLEQDPDDRYDDAYQLAADLEAFANSH